MLSQANLKEAFSVYLEELDRCCLAKCYWAMLHIIVIFPDLCGALESKNGKASPKKYEDWCCRYLNQELSPENWYELRCALLHQGHTFKHGRFRFSFGQPAPDGSDRHNTVFGQPDGQTRILDVDRLCILITQALRQWFRDLEEGKDKEKVRNVEANLPCIAKVDERTSEMVQGGSFVNLNTSSILR